MAIELHDVLISVLRWSIGVSCGCFIGLILGILSSNRKDNFIFSGFINFLRAVPIIGLVPVIQLIFGISEFGKIGLISWAVAFPVWISVKEATTFRLKETELFLKSHKISQFDFIKFYTIPRIINGLFQGINIAIGIGWLAVVASELIATYSKGFWSGGLGYKLFYAFSINNWKIGVTSLVIFGFLGLISSFLWITYGVVLFEKITNISTKKFY